MKRLTIFVFSIYGFLIFVLLMFLLLPLFIIALIMPQPGGGNAVYKLAYLWAWLLFLFTGIRYRPVYKFIPDRSRSYVFVTNHISYLDIPMMILATKGFAVRILAKSEMGRVPIFGFIYNKGAITVKRNDAEDRKESVERLVDALSGGISILICPEGTFNMTKEPLKFFFDGAFRIAADLRCPVLPVIFPDTYNRMNYRSVFTLTPGRCRAVFLPPIEPESGAGDPIASLKNAVFAKMEEEIVGLRVDWIKG